MHGEIEMVPTNIQVGEQLSIILNGSIAMSMDP